MNVISPRVIRPADAVRAPWAGPWRWVMTFAVIVALAAGVLAGWAASASAATIRLSPGSDLQNAVNANPPGTTFILQPGIYRGQSVTSLRNGDSFIGQPGAVMNGAKVLNGWTRVSIQGVAYWTAAGGRPLTPYLCHVPYGCCAADYPGCIYPQDLYVDNIEYHHVTSLAAAVARRSWYYDFDGNDGGIRHNIYLAAGGDPNSHRVELGDKAYAFLGTAASITIKNLIIEKYATPIEASTVESEGPNWLIQHNEVRFNHGVGISALRDGAHIRVVGNRVNYNGQAGIGGPGSAGLWDSNYVAYNNADGVNPDFDAGGSKFVGSHVVISNNVVHDNYGPGLWSDEGASYNTYDHNISYNNYGGGIRYEISRYGTITNNTVYGNTKNAQIVYTGSDHGRISGNRVIDNGYGAIMVVNIVGTRPYSKIFKVVDVQVTGNTIETSCNPHDAAVGLIDLAQPPQPGIFTDPTNLFDHNSYQLQDPSQRRCWAWGATDHGSNPIGWHAWQASGLDLHGKLIGSAASH